MQTPKNSLNLTPLDQKRASMIAMKAFPPQRLQPTRFSVKLSTEQNYKNVDKEFYGSYAEIRSTLDYNYHDNYTKQRQLLQDKIISSFIGNILIQDKNGDLCTTPTEPFIVFTAGAMGAGKGHTIKTLVDRGHFPLLAFVLVDPDEIRRHFPEYQLYVNQCPESAGELTRKEAGFVAEILTAVALEQGKNVLVDGSLRDSVWYGEYFQQLRDRYPQLKLAIIHVTAPRETIFRRAEVSQFSILYLLLVIFIICLTTTYYGISSAIKRVITSDKHSLFSFIHKGTRDQDRKSGSNGNNDNGN